MIALAIILVQASAATPWEKDRVVNPSDQFASKPERLGVGPHTLVITDGNAMTKIEYKSGSACQAARDATRHQLAPPPNTSTTIYTGSSVKAFCVPR